jgi:hypothetical protein
MSSRLSPSLLCALALAALASAASAQEIFRCGDSYSQTPCANAKVVALVPAATDAERAQAREVAARTKLLASEMVRDRRERERAIRPATAISIGPTAPARAASSAASFKKKHAKKRSAADDGEHDFVATVPKPSK